MGFIHRRTSRQAGKVKTLLGLALSRLAAARRPRLARKAISRGDVAQLLTLGHLDRALHRAGHVIEEDNMLEAFDMVELYCKRLIEHAAQLDKPQECGDDIKEAAVGIMFAAGRCGDLPELLHARTPLANKFGSDFAAMAKEGRGIVDPMLVRKLSGSKTSSMDLKKKVVQEIAAENNILMNFPELGEVVEQEDSSDARHHHTFDRGMMVHQDGVNVMSKGSVSESDHSPPHKKNALGLECSDKNRWDMPNSDGSNGQLKQEKVTASVRTRR